MHGTTFHPPVSIKGDLPSRSNKHFLHAHPGAKSSQVGPIGLYGVCDGHGPFGHLVSFRLVT